MRVCKKCGRMPRDMISTAIAKLSGQRRLNGRRGRKSRLAGPPGRRVRLAARFYRIRRKVHLRRRRWRWPGAGGGGLATMEAGVA